MVWSLEHLNFAFVSDFALRILTGALFDATGSYRLAFGVLTALAATGLALVLSLRPHRQAG